MRLFVATTFSDAMLDWLVSSELLLSELFPARSLRFTKVENLHLTLQFLGEVQGSQVGQISQIIEDALTNVDAFVFQPGLVGVFPNKFRPRTLWIGLEPAARFYEIATKLSRGLEKVVQTDAKRFLPHITLARFNEEHPALGTVNPAVATLPSVKILDRNRIINSVSLFKSELTPRGPIYSELTNIHLNKYAKL